METTKALAVAITAMEIRSSKLFARLESANSEYDKAEESNTSKSSLVSYAASVVNAKDEYEDNRSALEAVRSLHAILSVK